MRTEEHTPGVESRTFVDVLRERAQEHAYRVAFESESDDGVTTERLSYESLDRRARAIAARLVAENLCGQRAVLLYPHGLEFLAAFFGCLYAGVIAVPCSLPRRDRGMDRLRGIVADCSPRALLTAASLRDDCASWAADVRDGGAALRIATDEIGEALCDEWRRPDVGPNSLAFLQYTSGSTDAPKGVMISHGNLLANSGRIRASFASDEASRGVFWLPLFHDMGLIGGVLQTVDCGGRSLLMSPASFLRKPLRWLEAISRSGATISGGPDFAYDLCARKISPEMKAGLDLSRWKVAFNGAEPIRAATLDRFAEAFAPCGFRRAAFLPCYGLAEATLFVSGRREGTGAAIFLANPAALEAGIAEPAGDASGRALVGSGAPAHGHEVVVVQPESRTEVAEGRVGELWVRGPSVSGGYWGRDEESVETFAARRADSDAGPYLRTGDLGFLRGGEVFVSGRLKDLIIVRGRNLYPQDIEWTAGHCHPALRPGAGAAFVVDEGGEERVVLVHEVDRSWKGGDPEAIVATIRQAVAEGHDLDLRAIHLIRPMSLPLTSSGKVRRRACRDALACGELHAAASWTAAPSEPPEADRGATDLRTWLATRVAGASGVDPGTINRAWPITRFGLDSLRTIGLATTLHAEWGVNLPLEFFLDGPSLEDLESAALASIAAPPPEAQRVAPAVGDDHPLTAGQASLWYAHHLSRKPGAYNIAAAARLMADLDEAAFGRALDRLADRHESLRTRFPERDGRPTVVVDAAGRADFRRIDARIWPDATLDAMIADESARPFDLHRGPLLRVVLWTRPGRDRVALLAMHHIIADFWTAAILLDELARLYDEERAGKPASLGAAPPRFVDHARGQANRLAGPIGDRLATFWRSRLAGPLPELRLPADRPRPPIRSHRGGVRHMDLDLGLSSAVFRLSQALGATPYVTLLAAFQILLARLGGDEDVIVGSPVSGRTRAGLDGVVGYFVNVLPMRASFAGDPSFADFASGVRASVNQSLAHQDYPTARMVEDAQIEPDPGRSPIFQAMFIYQQAQRLGDRGLTPFALGAAGHRLDLGGLKLESLALDRGTSLFDLTLMAAPIGDRLGFALEYDADLFDPATADRILERFRILLAGIAADPSASVSSLPLMDDAERRRILREWGVGEAKPDARRDRCIHAIFEDVAAGNGSVAVSLGEDALSYEQLNAAANRIARHLRVKGVGPGRRVALCLPKSPRLMAAVLGVLKAGGAYVPLDPSHPADRLASIVRDSEAAVLIVEGATGHLAGDYRGELVDLDAETWGHQSPSDLGPIARPDDPAYVVYTSGSTGTPKGVVVSRRGLASAFLAWEDAYGLRPDGGPHLQMAGVAFDVFAGDWTRALCSGARLVLCPPETRLDPEALARLIAREAIAVAEFVPAVADILADFLDRTGAKLPSLRLIAVGSDAWRVGQYERLRRIFGPSARLIDSYGVTEATIDSTYFEGSLAHLPPDRPVPIGRPFAGTHVYVLDRHLRPVPPGVTGELVIGGAGVAIGYLNRPRLTAEAMIPDPFSGQSGARLYRTGDLARWTSDGLLEWLGRGDHQVKIRGHRVELGEVEAAMLQLEGIERAAVVVAAGRLVAWAVAASGSGLDEREARLRLRRHLPEFMIPSAIAFAASLPLSSNGKVDRRVLEAKEVRPDESREGGIAPRNEAEATLAQIVAGVLDLRAVGVEDDLLALGADSIAIIRIVARAREQGFRIDPVGVFRTPTVAGLAAALGGDGTNAPIPLDPFARLRREALGRDPEIEDAYPLSPVQEGMLYHGMLDEGSGVYVEQFHCRLDGDLDESAFVRAWNRLIARHPALRSSVRQVDSDRSIQVVARRVELPVSRHDLRGLDRAGQEARLREILAWDRRQGFVRTLAPLTRLALVRLKGRRHLIWTSDHLILDGWCLPILLSEVLAYYDAEIGGKPADLPPARPFRAYVEWLDRRDPAEAGRFWRATLSSFREPTPLDLPGPAWGTPDDPFAEVEDVLDAGTFRRLKSSCREARITLATAVQGAWALLLSRYSGRADVCFGVAVSGRPPELAGVEGMVGVLINTLPLRVEIDEESPLQPWLRAIQAQQVAMRQFESTPPVTVRSWSGVPRGRPLFESLVIFQNTPPVADLGAVAARLGIREPRVEDRTSYALTLTIVPEPTFSPRLAFDARRFDRAAVRGMLDHFLALLAGIADTPAGRLADLRLGEASPGHIDDELGDFSEFEMDVLPIHARRAMPEGDTA